MGSKRRKMDREFMARLGWTAHTEWSRGGFSGRDEERRERKALRVGDRRLRYGTASGNGY